MISKYTKVSALLCVGLIFMQSVTLQAMPISHDITVIDKEAVLKGYLQSTGETEEITLTNAENEEKTMTLPAMTTVSLRSTKTVTSKEVRKGAKIQFRVMYDIKVQGKTVIPAGSLAQGKVMYAQRPKMWGKPGKIEITMESLSIGNETVPLSSSPYTEEGVSRSTIAWVFFGVSLIILWPCIFVPFFIKGKDAVLTSGTTIDAYTTKAQVLPVVE